MNRIKELRQRHGWLQKDLESRLNLGRGNISKYEKEDRSLSPEIICQLCDLFEVSADYLLCRSEIASSVIPAQDANLLRAYHAASLRDRALVEQILQPYIEVSNKNNSKNVG